MIGIIRHGCLDNVQPTPLADTNSNISPAMQCLRLLDGHLAANLPYLVIRRLEMSSYREFRIRVRNERIRFDRLVGTSNMPPVQDLPCELFIISDIGDVCRIDHRPYTLMIRSMMERGH